MNMLDIRKVTDGFSTAPPATTFRRSGARWSGPPAGVEAVGDPACGRARLARPVETG
jgi:hypothetical protein